MPRKPRLDIQGLIYHVIARGIERRIIFGDDQDRQAFVDRLSSIIIDTGTLVYSFCLMPNHLHLLVRRTKYPLSTIMQRLLTSYALYFNKKYNRVGHLFQNRYKAIICEEDAYLFELIRYINLNPIRAKLLETMKDLGRYYFSSHPYIIGKKNVNWFDSDVILSNFSMHKKTAINSYLKFLRDGLVLKQDFDGGGLKRSLGLVSHSQPKQAFDDRILGNGEFVEKLLYDWERKNKNKSSTDVTPIISSVCCEHNITTTELTGKSKRKIVTKVRALLVFKLIRETELTASQIAAELKLSRSTISKIIAKHHV